MARKNDGASANPCKTAKGPIAANKFFGGGFDGLRAALSRDYSRQVAFRTNDGWVSVSSVSFLRHMTDRCLFT